MPKKRRLNPPCSRREAATWARILRANGYRTNPGDVQYATTRIIRRAVAQDPRTQATRPLKVVRLVFPAGVSINQIVKAARRRV